MDSSSSGTFLRHGASLASFNSAALYGWGLVDFDPSGVNLGKLSTALTILRSLQDGISHSATGRDDGRFRTSIPYNNSQRARANIYWVWNPTDNFSMGTWATYQFDDQGFTSYQVNGNGSISSASSDSHLFTAGIRPVYWLWGPFAIQGSFGYTLSLEQSSYRATAAGVRRRRFAGRLLDRPDHQARGGFFTRPELRAFATFAVWSDRPQGRDWRSSLRQPRTTDLSLVSKLETWF